MAGGNSARQYFHRSIVDEKGGLHLAADGGECRRELAGVQCHRQRAHADGAEPRDQINRAWRAQKRKRLSGLRAQRREQ